MQDVEKKNGQEVPGSKFGARALLQDEFDQISKKLSRELDPKYISSRMGPRGVRLFYLEGWRIVEAANEVFGFNGWSHSVVDLKIDYVRQSKSVKSINSELLNILNASS